MQSSSSLRNHAEKLNGTADNDSVTHSILTHIYTNSPIASSVMLVDADGVIRDVVPLNEHSLIGAPDGLKLTESEFPSYSSYMSAYRTLPDGSKGVTYSFPVYTADHTYAGYLSMNIDPNMVFGLSVADIRHSAGYDVWVATADGTVLYDADTFEIGKNLFTDPLYMDSHLQRVFTDMITVSSGTTSYPFYDVGWTTEADVDVIWKRINFTNGEYWVIVLTSTTPLASDRPVVISPESVAVEQFVYQALSYAYEHGKEAALEEFNNVSGEFTFGEYYIYAYDRNGTILALPYQQDQVGISQYDQVDRNGVKYIQQALARIAQGGGYMYFPHPNPVDEYTLEMKLSYLLPVDDEWFIGAGVYLPNISVSVDPEVRNAVMKQVRDMQSYGHVHGMNATLEVINNPDGRFAVEGLGPFAETTSGVILANALRPEQIGSNTLGITDSYGSSVARDVVNLANRGGGMIYTSYLPADPTSERLYLLYMELVDDTWFVGSSMPLTS